MTKIALPLPPSVNHLWRSGRGRVYRSPKYLAWIQEAGWDLATQRPKPVMGPVSISIAAGRPDGRRRDLDNASFKAVLDLLVVHRILQDDSLVQALSAR